MTDVPAGPAASPLAGSVPAEGSSPFAVPPAPPRRSAPGLSAPALPAPGLSAEPPAGALLTVVVPCFNERANVLPLVARLHAALDGLAWEVVFVDDNSPDGTAALLREVARHDRRVRCLRRVGRRGLSSAVIEGALSSSADYVAVMDGDLQHDEAQLPALLAALRGGADVAVGSRYLRGGTAAGLSGAWRQRLSRGGTALVQSLLPARLTDPMSGMFMLSRPLFERLAPRLTGQGFKILLDLLLSAPTERTRGANTALAVERT
ncbi:MAG: glycosyltransferase, partial [Janthinobacterium lividum]